MDDIARKPDDHEDLRKELDRLLGAGAGPRIARFMLALLSGTPFVGGVFSGTAGEWSDAAQENVNRIVKAWMQLQQDEIEEIGRTMAEVLARIDVADEQVSERVRSPEFLSLVKKCFREW